MQCLTVSEVNTYLRTLLDTDEVVSDIWITGEVSAFKRAPSGHCYFSLKDGNALLNAVMWRSYAARLDAPPTTGDAVLVHGRVSLYEGRGEVQLQADTIQFAGAGVLQARFEELKSRLEAEGLFDERHKRPIPTLPGRIGVATSAQAAALHDILTVLERRCPLVEVFVAPCTVQGEQAPPSIVAALELLAKVDVDVIILARGGGSLEDLSCFNDEQVVRAVFACPVPIITGVGHETDTTIVDYVADVRAPTPSVAAELAVPERADLDADLDVVRDRMDTAVAQVLEQCIRSLNDSKRRLQRQEPYYRLSVARQQVDDRLRRLTMQTTRWLTVCRARLNGVSARLQTLNPQATLQRGFAMLHRPGDGAVVSSIHQVAPGDLLHVLVQDGMFIVRVGEGGTVREQKETKEP